MLQLLLLSHAPVSGQDYLLLVSLFLMQVVLLHLKQPQSLHLPHLPDSYPGRPLPRNRRPHCDRHTALSQDRQAFRYRPVIAEGGHLEAGTKHAHRGLCWGRHLNAAGSQPRPGTTTQLRTRILAHRRSTRRTGLIATDGWPPKASHHRGRNRRAIIRPGIGIRPIGDRRGPAIASRPTRPQAVVKMAGAVESVQPLPE